jgi:WD40 repeat protein/serine/threonine protein kinase
MTIDPIVVRDLFLDCLERPDGPEREAFLDAGCLDSPELRHQVQMLLAAHQQSGTFLDRGPSAVRSEFDDLFQQPLGSQIGPYTLRELLGEGGMGLVYVAEQQVPIRRKVALKIIKPGMDTREVIARFEAERQALAMMDHPNIAKVLDAGTTGGKGVGGKADSSLSLPPSSFCDAGRPYFVMELVRGIPITQYCDESGACTDERLALFVQVCQAIQHAHQKGVIHRDIKPTNVLVTVIDGVPIPKVIDFGVAKAIGQRLTDTTIHTRFALMIGTPLYMSPEQADISGVDVDTRSDIYSLGVLLYQLLTGVTPFDQAQFAAADWDQRRRMIRETEPPRPSTRVTTLQATCTSTCPRCRGEPRKLVRRLCGELDWIVMKALEKDRSRRYQTARGLAADVQRYLDGNPVEACPPSWRYRFGKLLRRHKVPAIAIALIAMALMVGTGVSLWQALEAHDARRLADARLAAEIEARQQAVQRETSLRRELYATDINLAWRYWQEGDAARCAGVLDRQRPTAEQEELRGFEWYYLQRCVLRKTVDYCGHEAPILTADVSPDNRWVASGDRSGAVKIWHLDSGRLLQTLRYSSLEVCGVRFSPDSRTLATAGQDRTLRLWDVETWEEIARFEGHEMTICGIVWSPDGRWLASAARDHTVRIWDVAGGGEPRVLTGHTDVVRCVVWSPDGKTLASAGADLLVRLWDTESWQPSGALDGHHEGLLALAFSPDGRWLASAGYNTPLILHDCAERTEWARILEPGNVWSLAFSPDSELLAVGGNEGRVVFWQLAEQAERLLPVRADVSSQDAMRAIVFAQGGQRLLTVSEDDRRIRLEPLAELIGHDTYRFSDRCLAVNHRRGVAATTDASGAVRVRQWPGGQLQFETKPHAAAVFHAVFSPQGDLLASCGNDRAVCLHDVATGRLLHRLLDPGPLILSPVFSPDARWLAAGNDNGEVLVWRTETGELAHRLSAFRDQGCPPVAFSPDGRVLAAGTHREIALFEAETGRLLDRLTGSRRSTFSLAFSPDGAWLAAGGNGSISLWDVAARQEAAVLLGHQRGVFQLAFSPDGRTLASVGDDLTVRLWHMATRRELFVLLRSDRELPWLEFTSPRTLLVGFGPNNRLASEVLVFGDPP